MKGFFNHRWRLLLAGFIAPLLFVPFFMQQVYHVYAHDFSVWKGGGMGMFSSPDHPSKRHLFYFVTLPDGTRKQVWLGFSDDRAYRRETEFMVLPSPRNLERYRQIIFSQPWYVGYEGEAELHLFQKSGYEDSETTLVEYPLAELTIELWKMAEVNGERNELTIKPAHVFTISP